MNGERGESWAAVQLKLVGAIGDLKSEAAWMTRLRPSTRPFSLVSLLASQASRLLVSRRAPRASRPHTHGGPELNLDPESSDL